MKKRKKYAMGSEAGEGSDFSGLLAAAPDLLNSLIEVAEGGQKYSKQPIVNAQTINNMAAAPYKMAFGGSIDDLDEYELEELTREAEELGMTVEELFEQKQADIPEEEVEEIEEYEEPEEEGIDEYEEESEEYAMGGPVNNITKGKVTNAARRDLMTRQVANPYGKYTHIGNDIVTKDSPTELEAMLNNIEYMKNNIWTESNIYRPENMHIAQETNTAVRKASVPVAAYGASVPIEAEGGEVVETPDGSLSKLSGKSHEEGGIDLNVEKGTGIYSDRLAVDGDTMADRKVKREKRLARIKRATTQSSSDILAKNSSNRTKETTEKEEQQDMALQKIASKIYAAPTEKAALGAEVGDDPYDPFGIKALLSPNVPILGEQRPPLATKRYTSAGTLNRPTVGTPTLQTAERTPTVNVNSAIDESAPESSESFTTGDYVGMAGNLFNAIAPIVNTKNAAAATKPNINRFKKFGKDAIDTANFAETYVGAAKGEELADAETSANTAFARNRNSASGVNTVRALDALTTMGRNKNRANIVSNASNKMIGLLGRKSQLQNQRDNVVMTGEMRRDEADKADTDNYYSNMAQNLVNAGVNIEGLGKNLNASQLNEDQLTVMAEMTKNGVKLKRKNGKFTIVNK